MGIRGEVDTVPGMGILMGSLITYATKQVSWLKRLQRPMEVKVSTVPQGIILKCKVRGKRHTNLWAANIPVIHASKSVMAKLANITE